MFQPVTEEIVLFCGSERGVETVSKLLDVLTEKLQHLKKIKVVAITIVTVDTGVVMISWNTAGEKLEII